MDREDRERLIRIDERTANIVKRLDDHGARLKSLERARLIATGAVGVVGFIFYAAKDVAVGWMKTKIGSHG